MEVHVREVRARIAFYASTPSYRPAFDHHGYTDLTIELAQLSKAQRWDKMPRRISDEMLNTNAVVGTYDNISNELTTRYAGIVNATVFSVPVSDEGDETLLAEMVARIQVTSR